MAHHVTGGMKGIQGLEVVRANGELIHTGSWARRDFPEPYYRDYGPDLTGLFLGDTGAFGIKTAVSLHLSRPPEASAFASFSFDTMAQQTEVMVELAALDFVTMRSGFDPYLTSIVMNVNLGEGIKTLSSVVKAGGRRVGAGCGGPQKSPSPDIARLKMRIGRCICAPTSSPRGRQMRGMARARAICLRKGREIAPSAAIAMGAGAAFGARVFE